MMFDINELNRHISLLDAAVTNDEKGKTLEQLSKYLFNCIDGIQVRETNIDAPGEEVDLLLWNARTEETFEPWDTIISVECKNWSRPAGACLIDSFASKIDLKHLKTGIFIAASGITGDFVNGQNENRGAVYRIHEHLVSKGMRIVVIRMDDIRTIRSVSDFLEIIKDRYCKIYMHKLF